MTDNQVVEVGLQAMVLAAKIGGIPKPRGCI
jgi:hypothetical protein